MSTVTLKAGRVPGSIETVTLNGEKAHTVYEALVEAARIMGEKRGLGKPAFEVHREEYKSDKGDSLKIDVPTLNGKKLATKTNDRWSDVNWDKEVQDNDQVLLMPQIQGNLLNLTVFKGGQKLAEVSVFEDEKEAGYESQDIGAFSSAIKAAETEFDYRQETLVAVDDTGEAFTVDDDDEIASNVVKLHIVEFGELEKFNSPSDYIASLSVQKGVAGTVSVTVDETDPTQLNAKAEELSRQSDSVSAEIETLQKELKKKAKQSAELKNNAEALKQKANRINSARDKFTSAVNELIELGVLLPERAAVMADLLTLAIRRDAAQPKPNAKAKKAGAK